MTHLSSTQELPRSKYFQKTLITFILQQINIPYLYRKYVTNIVNYKCWTAAQIKIQAEP